MSDDRFTPEERQALDACIGKLIVGYSQDPYRGSGDLWQDEEPLKLQLSDGTVLSIHPHGWHDSGGLSITIEPSDIASPTGRADKETR